MHADQAMDNVTCVACIDTEDAIGLHVRLVRYHTDCCSAIATGVVSAVIAPMVDTYIRTSQCIRWSCDTLQLTFSYVYGTNEWFLVRTS